MNEQNENKTMEFDPFKKESVKESEMSDDVVEDIQTSKKADLEISDAQAEAIDEEKKNSESKDESATKDEDGVEKDASVKEATAECSFSCEPPYGEVRRFGTQDADRQHSSKRRYKNLSVLLLGIALALTFIAGAVAGQWFLQRNPSLLSPSSGNIQGTPIHSSYSEVVDAVANTVVEIEGSGSGVIIDRRGYILTNEHVVSKFLTSQLPITVVLSDGTRYENAIYVGGDADYDIAVLKVESKEPLPEAKIGKSELLKVGDEVLAIGNPLASLGGTVTNGIISAGYRYVRINQSPIPLLQTNAEINPGNSGGGLFNMAGELVGIVSAKIMYDDQSNDRDIYRGKEQTGDEEQTVYEGLGFAISIEFAWACVEDIVEYGYVTGKPDVGAVFEEAYNSVIVSSSTNDLLQKNDRILFVEDIRISKLKDLYSVFDQIKIGDIIEMKIQRGRDTFIVEIEVVEYKPEK